MKNVSHKKKWNTAVLEQHLDLTPTLLTKINHDDNSDKHFVKIKMRKDPTLENSDLYELKIALFDNGDPEEFF